MSDTDQPIDRDSAERAPVDRARLDRVFGNVLPETTGDERAADDGIGQDASDDWIRQQVPPHHG
ncbi:hypothetical protein FOY51_04040 [Antrihabitans cavernicola]|uniref:Uncharacterized protein n=1 Tax=Antrihabitans cavernicola TaxID=2495913 RepID=A0A5A7SIK4_9NOCA|nr:hypothetical protein [Spelaeibacter cavernicola]KAA0024315.1 hypothetical protein FOY51_04040 [Spelaeibacter cavernicola]